MTPQPNYYAIIPAPVLNHPGLAPSEKLFYAQVTGLLGERGYCWASNAYFADKLDVSVFTISRWISSLQAAGFLRVEISQVTGNERRIYVSETLPLLRKSARPSPQKTQEGLAEKRKTLLRKSASRVVIVNNNSEVVKVSGENAPANQKQDGVIQGQGDTSMPSGGGAARSTTFAESAWAAESAEAWRVALVTETNIPDLDASWYFNRVKDWSAEKASTSANWVVTAAKFARDDQRKSKLVTLKSANHDSDRHTLLTNPLTGNTTNLERVSRAAASAQRVIARRRAAGL